MIVSPIVDIPIYHPIRASREHDALIIRSIDTFANRKASDIDLCKTNKDANIDDDALPISYRRRLSRPPSKRLNAPSRRPGNTAVAPFESQASKTSYITQSHSEPTHITLSIHLGPCLDQHPACGLVATQGSAMERGPLVLLEGGRGGGGGMLWEGRDG